MVRIRVWAIIVAYIPIILTLYYVEYVFTFYIIPQHWSVEILSPITQEHPHLTWSISWLLMTWRRQEPGHQQPWYWPSCPGIFQAVHYKADLSSYPGYFQEAHWISMGLPKRFRVSLIGMQRWNIVIRKVYPVTCCVVGGVWNVPVFVVMLN